MHASQLPFLPTPCRGPEFGILKAHNPAQWNSRSPVTEHIMPFQPPARAVPASFPLVLPGGYATPFTLSLGQTPAAKELNDQAMSSQNLLEEHMVLFQALALCMCSICVHLPVLDTTHIARLHRVVDARTWCQIMIWTPLRSSCLPWWLSSSIE